MRKAVIITLFLLQSACYQDARKEAVVIEECCMVC